MGIRFWCRERVVPIEEIEEIRIVHTVDCKSQTQTCGTCKCVWGFPTRMDKTVFIYTRSVCSNYQLGLKDMDEFVADNSPPSETPPPPPPPPEVVGATKVGSESAKDNE